MRNTIPVLIGLAASFPVGDARASGAGEMDFGGHIGLFLPGKNHELYDSLRADHKPLSAGMIFGARFGWQPHDLIGLEMEAELIPAWALESSLALLSGWRTQVLFYLPPGGLEMGLSPYLLTGLGTLGVNSSVDALGKDGDLAVHWGAGVEYGFSERIELRGGFAHFLSSRWGLADYPAHHFAITVGVSYRIFKEGGPEHTPRVKEDKLPTFVATAEDADADGIQDKLDQCPTEKEVYNGWHDKDGCPDELASVRVTVKDPTGKPVRFAMVVVNGEDKGVTDEYGELRLDDLGPGTEIEVQVVKGASGFLPADPKTLVVEEGAQVLSVALPYKPRDVLLTAKGPDGSPVDARVSFYGPEAKAPVQLGLDGQETVLIQPGSWTLVLDNPLLGAQRRTLDVEPLTGAETAVEPQAVDIEMKMAAAKIEDRAVAILQKVEFGTNSADIDLKSSGLLDDVAAVLMVHPEIKKVEVQGHTDSEGDDSDNLRLSQERAESVVKALVERGVSADRLIAKGYGETKAIADNRTPAGREKNRRVEFVILIKD